MQIQMQIQIMVVEFCNVNMIQHLQVVVVHWQYTLVYYRLILLILLIVIILQSQHLYCINIVHDHLIIMMKSVKLIVGTQL